MPLLAPVPLSAIRVGCDHSSRCGSRAGPGGPALGTDSSTPLSDGGSDAFVTGNLNLSHTTERGRIGMAARIGDMPMATYRRERGRLASAAGRSRVHEKFEVYRSEV